MTKSWQAVVDGVVLAQAPAEAAALQAPLSDSLDQRLFTLIEKIEKEFTLGSPLAHEPALVEPLLGDIAALLDRCAAYQREASELEIKWVQHQLESDVSRDLGDLDLELSISALGKEAATAAQRIHADTALQFTQVSGEPLSAGFAKEAQGASVVASTALDVAGQREKLLAKRTEKLRDYQASLNARHLAPGGAHNYLERYERISTLMFEDFEEAYRKAKCVVLGLQSVFEIEEKDARLPAFNATSPSGPVFELILWTRRMMRRVESFSETEAEYELVLPLLQPFRDATKSLVTRDEYNAAMKDGGTGVLNVTLPENLFASQSRVRLRAVGVSFVVANIADANQAAARLPITLFPPLQDLPSGQQRRRPGIALGTVLPFGSQMAVARTDGLTVHNVKPAGEWRIMVQPFFITGNATVFKRIETNPVDLRLHLYVVSAPNADPAKWKVGP